MPYLVSCSSGPRSRWGERPTRPLRLGIFFTYWSSSQTEIVAQTPPVPLDCPFCGQHSDAVIRIYNAKTKHYSVLTVGKGKFYCTFVCRNCTNEGQLAKKDERLYVRTHLAGLEYDKIVELHKVEPGKARHRLEKLVKKYPDILAIEEMRQTLDGWRKELPHD